MKKYKIERVSLVGKKSPRRPGPPAQYPFSKVKVGESFLVPKSSPKDKDVAHQKRRLRNVFYYYRNQGKVPKGAEFRFIEEPIGALSGDHIGVRVGRVK